LQRRLLAGARQSAPSVTSAVRYEAASDGLEIGGDWYDLFDLADGRLGFVVGDVVGKGLAAAATMAKLRSALRALAFTDPDPSVVFENLDRYVGATDDADCTTLVYGVLDPRSRELQYACAGHPPPLLLAPDGSTRWMQEGRSLPLGITRGRRSAGRLTVPAGSTVIAFSDGLIERRGESIDDGLQRLDRAAGANAGLGIEELADAIVAGAVGEEVREDDIALLCLRLETEPEKVFSRALPARPASLAPMRHDLSRYLTAQGLDDPLRGDILLACNEASANSIEHAYGNGGDGEFIIEVRRVGDELRLTVRDFGRWRETARSDTGGRGMALMRSLTDDLEYVTHASGGTMVRMRVALQPQDA
jgi:anti-sigma regulatory factor (Ser/Thr protein kinase)